MRNTDYKLAMLAGAEKDEAAVHDLRLPADAWVDCGPDSQVPMCGLKQYELKNTIPSAQTPCRHRVPGWKPNRDPMALIAAVLAVETYGRKLWTVHIWVDDDVTIGLGNNYHRWEGTDLTDALFKATLTLEPDNWMKCSSCLGDGEIAWSPVSNPMPPQEVHREECQVCYATGWEKA